MVRTQKASKKARKKNASHQAELTWIHFAVIIAAPWIILFLFPRHWPPFPWVVGPFAWLATIAAVISFLHALITRKGLTVGSLGSCIALAAFIVAGTVYLLAPPIGPLVSVLLTQVSAAALVVILAVFLRTIQVGMDPQRHVEFRPLIPNPEMFRQWLVRVVPLLVLWDGLTVIFYNTPCRGGRCGGGEALFGVHGPFSNIYYAAYFGIMAFAPPITAGLQALQRLVKRPDDKNEMSQ
ncbi:hypothetical protein [Rhizobium sp. BR 314]|uniref:hypothetical protein n=1 Tax=Rhizobium sp. BR 314 TaxID=3040013 RepID=UPI0039BF6A22